MLLSKRHHPARPGQDVQRVIPRPDVGRPVPSRRGRPEIQRQIKRQIRSAAFAT